MSFCHLHTHTTYSLLDGSCKIKELVARAKELGMTSLAISDHGVMFGAIEFYEECLKQGIKPIIGMEAYMAPADRRDRTTGSEESKSAYHLLLLAENLQGYKNLTKLSTISYREGFYYKPRIDKQTLAQFKEGLICTSACLGGELAQGIMNHRQHIARETAEWYAKTFGPDRFFVEVQGNGVDEQARVNPELQDLAKKLGVGTVMTNDVHFLKKDDHFAHDVLCCVSMKKDLQDPTRLKYPTELYLKSPEEMAQSAMLWGIKQESLDNTARIASMCDVRLDLKTRHAPKYKVPNDDGLPGADEVYLRQRCEEGLKWRYPHGAPQEVKDRLQRELQVIASKDFSSYFLIVWDVCNYCRENRIPIGARGSAVGTVVGYLLGLCNVDPVRYGLLFERFMDPSRNEMPDVDLDMCQDGRGAVIEYVKKKYGHVSQIITFNTLGAKAAVRDVARVMRMDLNKTDQVAKLIPNLIGVTLQHCLEEVPDFKALYDTDAQVAQVVDVAQRLEGLARNAGVHAAGVVIADKPLDEFLPLYERNEVVCTQFEGPIVEKVGLLKMDFLGLRTLTTMYKALDLIKARTGQDVDIEAIDYEDQKVLDLFRRGETKGIFQFESDGMRQLLIKMRPDRIEDLIAANALYRPGPMDLIPEYVERKHGVKQVPSVHPAWDRILSETYGIMVYQEDVMKIFNQLGGIELASAYKLIKAISKKQADVIDSLGGKFIEGCQKNGLTLQQAETIFGDIKKFASYGFNKCISVDTKLHRPTKNRKDGFHPTVGEMYRIRNDAAYARSIGKYSLHQRYRHRGYGKSLSMNESGRLVYNRIVDIRYEGKDTVYEITTQSGKSIKCNARHKFPTPTGQVKADRLQVGDCLYVRMPYEVRKNWYADTDSRWTSQSGDARPKWEALQRELIVPGAKCETCDQEHDRLELHHRDEDYTNSDRANAQVLCPSCHKKEHYRRGRVKAGQKGRPVGTEQIVSIIKIGEEDVYDVEMEAPHHTFVTDTGIVTCNSHATRYSVIAYQTAYLKVYHPSEFFTALLTLEAGDTEKLTEYLYDARHALRPSGERGFRVLPPDVNESGRDFTCSPDGGTIRFGLGAVKGVGEDGMQLVIVERVANGPYRSLADFCDRVPGKKINSARVESLIKCGAFDSLGVRRSQLLSVVQQAAAGRSARNQDRKHGQFGLFTGENSAPEKPMPDLPELPRRAVLEAEKELLGFYVTGHPLEEYADMVHHYGTHTIGEALECPQDEVVTVAGMLVNKRLLVTKRGKDPGRQMAVVKIEDRMGETEVVMFPDAWDHARKEAVRGDLAVGHMVFVLGTVDRRREMPSLVGDYLIPAALATEKLTTAVVITLTPRQGVDAFQQVKPVLEDNKGKTPVFLQVKAPDGSSLVVRLDSEWSVYPSDSLHAKLQAISGPGSVQMCGLGTKRKKQASSLGRA